MDEFKKAEKINTMDITPERRKEVADAKEKMKVVLVVVAKMERSNVPVHSSSLAGSSNTRVASPSGRGRRVNQVPPSRFGNSGQRIPSRQQLLNGVDAKFGERLLDEMLDRTGVKLSDVAKAVASESNQVFFNISAASLTSKWVGDSEKTIRSLFQIAKNAQPAIIFIGKFGHFLENEIDSILCDRSEKDTEVSRRMKTEFLLQFDGATSSPDDRVLVIGATNRPYELDDAVLRRFPKRIHLGLPDGESRFTLLKAILDKHNMSAGLTDYDIRKIASKTDGYSNSDLVALCKEAAMVPIRSIDREKLATCDESKLRKLKSSDFDKALTVIRPSSNERSLQCLSDFWRRAGQF
uniref:AAA domain-containing protein n=1 Tax=Angiostrongylus cantonensis TaxID=6313 RepID=A0A0K0DDE6_ANGCA